MAKPNGLYVLIGMMLTVLGAAAYVAYRTRRVPAPRRRWWRFHRPGAWRLPASVCTALQGIYTVDEGREFFGDTAVVKCTYTVEGKKRIFHLSFFCQKAGTYIVCEARQRRGVILLYGYWRRSSSNGTGLVHLVMNKTAGAKALLLQQQPDGMLFQGKYGSGNKKPNEPFSLRYQQPLPAHDSFEIIGHRGAARNVDFLPVSENSLQMMKMAARLGATGVEIDVRMTKDGVPVVFHDSFLSVHTVQDKFYGGLIHNYTLEELKKIKLRKGGIVPTLDECLHTILHKTPLRIVWLDIKKECNLQPIREMQERYLQRAKAIGRELYIYIGIPDADVLRCFIQLDNYKAIPSLVEMKPDVVRDVNADVWAPQYTGGFQAEAVAAVKAAGKKAFVWSLDSEFLIDLYISKGGFDGLVTNSPPVVAHWYYTSRLRQIAPLRSQPQ